MAASLINLITLAINPILSRVCRNDSYYPILSGASQQVLHEALNTLFAHCGSKTETSLFRSHNTTLFYQLTVKTVPVTKVPEGKEGTEASAFVWIERVKG